MDEFRTSIFEKSKAKDKTRFFYNLSIFGGIAGIFVLYFIGFPIIGLKTAIGFSIALLGIKLYQDKYMGITAYGERRDSLLITEDYLEIRGEKIKYIDVTNLVIYINEYLGMPKEFFGIHHGGNNTIEFNYKGKPVLINYVIKNKQDYDRVSMLVDKIEKNPNLKNYLKKL